MKFTCTMIHHGPTMAYNPEHRLNRTVTKRVFIAQCDESMLVMRGGSRVSLEVGTCSCTDIFTAGTVFKANTATGRFQVTSLLQVAIWSMDWVETYSVLFAEALI